MIQFWSLNDKIFEWALMWKGHQVNFHLMNCHWVTFLSETYMFAKKLNQFKEKNCTHLIVISNSVSYTNFLTQEILARRLCNPYPYPPHSPSAFLRKFSHLVLKKSNCGKYHYLREKAYLMQQINVMSKSSVFTTCSMNCWI